MTWCSARRDAKLLSVLKSRFVVNNNIDQNLRGFPFLLFADKETKRAGVWARLVVKRVSLSGSNSLSSKVRCWLKFGETFKSDVKLM